MTDSFSAFGKTARQRKVFFLIIVAIALVLILAWPTTTTQSPFWEVWVVDEMGQPLEGMTVTLFYQNYSAESEGHSEQKRTDAGGYVVFPQRSLKASRLRRIVTTLQSAGAGVHASFGPHAHARVDGNGLTGYTTDWTGAPARMSSTVVVSPN
jgi:hypothetical protein